MSACWLQPGSRAFGLMLRLRRLLLPGVPGLVAAVAVEATRRLAALLAEEGRMEFPAALPATSITQARHKTPRTSGGKRRPGAVIRPRPSCTLTAFLLLQKLQFSCRSRRHERLGRWAQRGVGRFLARRLPPPQDKLRPAEGCLVGWATAKAVNGGAFLAQGGPGGSAGQRLVRAPLP